MMKLTLKLPIKLSHSLLATSALLLSAAGALAQAPTRSVIPLLDAATIAARCDGALAAARASIRGMEQARGSRGVLAEFNTLELGTGGFLRPVYLLANVATDAATRDAAQACVAQFAPLSTELFQSERLFKRVQALRPGNAVDRRYRQDLLDGFADTGASLPPDKRARAKAIEDELSVLGLAFQKAVNEDQTKVTLGIEEAAGLPAAWLAARKRDEQGRLVLSLDYPTVQPLLSNGTVESARRKVWTAFQNRAGQANLERLDRALKLRSELAQLHGQPDFATMALRRRMAGTPKAVGEFLTRVHEAVVQGEARELAELRAEKAALLGQPMDKVTVERWDVSFLQERLKRSKYAIDQEKLRAYFPTDKSVQFAIKLAERLYGVEFVAATVPLWHADVRYFDVYERAHGGRRGAFIGGIYLDLTPRDGKYSHAAAFPVVPASRLAGQKPASVLVTNFNPTGLDHEELETLLHEFGHVLHGVLSTARYADQAGTAVKRDFVEAPSQMFEEWARRPETLAVLAEVCSDCPRLSPDELKRLDDARKFGRGIRYARQWQYATYDMRLHSGAPGQALPAWMALERSMALGYVEGTMLPANFGHLMGGYAAGYYGYMWSEVMALDMLSAFKGKLMDPATGKRYRELILARGGEVEPQAMVERFLGRKPSTDAFFAEITGRR
ncbi:MAG: Zn-dependent oligopeptidase [Leptothrix sp. (in: Bacteria)]|nr:Zn-dependent oligopeptidase [Leptothrix sp. (in: b-proteobacteria)]